MEMAIAWALGRKANPESKESDRMLPEEADIDAHIKWLENKEAIYFDHTWSCRLESFIPPLRSRVYIVDRN